MSLSDYYRIVSTIQTEIESITGNQWKIPHPHEYDELLPDATDLPDMLEAAYDYLVYLRHHGFPSPLLDWTRSPYVAAFFAFKDATADGSVAIYAYLEYTARGKVTGLNAPFIQGTGRFVRTHPRHHLQQADYTACVAHSAAGGVYASHETVFSNPVAEQDVLCKFVLPGSERRKVLEHFQRFNLNSYSLFGTEDSLIEALELQYFVINEP